MTQKAAEINMKRVDINSIIEAKYNPRVDLQPGDPDYEKIKNSIEGFGYADPMIVNSHNNVLISGHQRLKILRAAGYTHADVSFVNIEDENKEMAMNMAMNNIRGREDSQKLRDIFLRFDAFDENIKLAGYEEQEFENLKKFDESLPDEKLGKTAGEAKEVYDAGAIKQIVLYYTGDNYERTVKFLADITSEKGLESNTEAVDFLIHFYESNSGR